MLVGPLVLVAGRPDLPGAAGDRPDLAVAGGALVALLLLQGALGGLTVLDLNSPWSVAIHLGNALLVLTVVLRIVVVAPRLDRAVARPGGCSRRPCWPGVWRCSP